MASTQTPRRRNGDPHAQSQARRHHTPSPGLSRSSRITGNRRDVATVRYLALHYFARIRRRFAQIFGVP